MENKELEVKQATSPAEMIMKAVSGGADLDKLEKLLSLQERWEANEAKKAYHQAMTGFKANPPKIRKDKKVGYDSKKTGDHVGYSHATLANVCDTINSELSKYGLSASWETSQNGQIIVTCKITHVKGHSEETSLSAPADTSGSKNAIQAIGSTITYLERYTLLALTGLATYDQDDDGAVSRADFASDDQRNNLKGLLQENAIKESKMLKYLAIESFDDLTEPLYQKALTAIDQYKNKAKK